MYVSYCCREMWIVEFIVRKSYLFPQILALFILAALTQAAPQPDHGYHAPHEYRIVSATNNSCKV